MTRLALLSLCSLLALHLTAEAGKLDPNTCVAGGSASYRQGLTPWAPGSPGRAMLRHTLTGTNARCNDGSPGVMYLRPAPAGSLNADKWVIHFDGGGGCRSEDECLARWCGLGTHSFDQASKMSSLGAPEGLAVQGGILNEVGGGPFSDYNHVLLHYCSSDNWVGSGPLGVPVDPDTGVAVLNDIEFEGEAIVADAIATLRAGSTFADPLAAARFYNVPMPDLDAATRVLITGDSAGGGGARHHVDRIASQLAAETILVVDAAFAPAFYKANIRWNAVNPANPYVDYIDMMTSEQEPVARGLWSVDDSALDESCLATAPASPELYCLDTDWVLENHITTPFFVHQDLTDPLAMPTYAAWSIFASAFDYAVATFDQLVDVQTAGVEARAKDPGVLGLNCNNHIASRDTVKFTTWRVTGLAGSQAFADLLDAWMTGATGLVNLQTDNPAVAGYNASFCP
jgi:hypothetical protein